MVQLIHDIYCLPCITWEKDLTEEKTSAVDPMLRDVLATALREAPLDRQRPLIVIHGNGNVFAFGGQVHIHHTHSARKLDDDQD